MIIIKGTLISRELHKTLNSGVPKKRGVGAHCRPKNTLVLVMGTPKRYPQIWVNPKSQIDPIIKLPVQRMCLAFEFARGLEPYLLPHTEDCCCAARIVLGVIVLIGDVNGDR